MVDNLQAAESIDDARVRDIVKNLEALPTLPDQSLKIINMFMAEEPDIRDIVRLIESDPAICMKILKVVNAPALGLHTAIRSVRKAVLLLGFSEVRSLLLSVVVSESIVKPLRENGSSDMENLWKHSLACAIISESMAKEICPSKAAEAFVSGLLHDVGRLILATCFPEAFDRMAAVRRETKVSFSESEKAVLGIDHGTVGKWLAEKWRLPEIFTHVIWLHHHAPATLADLEFIADRKIVTLVQLADQLAHETMADAEGPCCCGTDENRSALAGRIGLTPDVLDGFAKSLGKTYSERACILDMDETEASFYYDALQRANRRWTEAEERAPAPVDVSSRFLTDLHEEMSRMDGIEPIFDHVAQSLQSRLGKTDGIIYCKNPVLKLLVGRYWSPGKPPVPFSLPLDENRHPRWCKPPEMPPELYRLTALSYRQFALLPNIWNRTATETVIEAYRAIPFFRKGFFGAMGFREERLSSSGSGPSPSVDSQAWAQMGQMVGHTLANVVLVDKLRVTADSLSDALMRNRRMVATLKKTTAEKQQMEQKLLNVHKLESLSLMAGGIAHDFNNSLTAITGSVALARMYLKPGHKAFVKLGQAERAIGRARELNEQLLGFSKGKTPEKKAVWVMDPLKDAIAFTLSGSNVRCECDIPDDIAHVEADEGQIHQVFSNLLINAVQAMPDGGMIRVRAESIDVEKAHGLPLPRGRYVRVSIRDRGPGMDRAHMRKIFDPFFTTKPNGSGLGLSMAYTIIKNHSGYVEAESEPDRGSVFNVYLPVSSKPPSREPAPKAVLKKGTGNILIMDDEAELRDITGEMLGLLGYEASFARDGVEAIEKYRTRMASTRPFHAVLMDLTVPGGMGGKEAIGKLRKMDPEVRAVVTSGYADDPTMLEYRSHGFCGALAKPFRMLDLSRMLHDIHHRGLSAAAG